MVQHLAKMHWSARVDMSGGDEQEFVGGGSAAPRHTVKLLPLLPSGPGGVYSELLRRDRTAIERVSINRPRK